MLSAAVRVPLAAGVNKIAIVQVPPAGTAGLQVSTSVKSPALAPVKTRPEMLKLAPPVLLRVTTCEELTMSTPSLPKDKLVGERLAAALALPPVPARLTLCGLPEALSVTMMPAVRVPAADGLKVTLIVQLAPAAKLDPQLFVCAKSLALAPDTAMPVILKAAAPELLSVTV
jgi:hypothetical protein